MRVVPLIFFLVSCSSTEPTQQLAECEVGAGELSKGIALAREKIEGADGEYVEYYRFSVDHGATCGFWFETSLKPGDPRDLIAGPTEVILFKEGWIYVETKYHSHEQLVE